MKLPKSVKIYLGFIFTIGSVLLAGSIINSSLYTDKTILIGVIFFTLLGAMAESLPVRIEGDNLVTVSDTVSIAVILLFDVPTAVIVRFLGAILAVRRSQNRYTHLFNTPIYKSLFNGFCRGITVFLAWHAYHFLDGLAPKPVIMNFGLIGLLGLVAVYFVADQILFAILFSFLSKTSFILEINKKLWAIKQLLALTPLGMIVAGLYSWQGILPIIFLVGPFLFTRNAIEQTHDRLEKQKKIEEALRSSEEKFSKAFHASPMAITLQRVSDLRYVDINEGFTKITGYSREEALEHTINELNLYPDREISTRMLEQLQTQGFIRDFEFPFRRKNGEIGYGLGWGEPIEINGEAMYIAGTIEITERKRAEEKIQQRVNELATVNAVSQVASSQLELDKMIELTAEKLLQLPDIHSLFIALYDPLAQVIKLPYYREYDDVTNSVTIPFGQGLTAWVIQNRLRLVINDDLERRSTELGAVQINTPGQTYRAPKSWLGVPIRAGNQIIGVLAIQNFEREYAFTEDDERLWETIAANIGIAIQNAQLYTASQQEIAERRRVEILQAEQAQEISTLYNALSKITGKYDDVKSLAKKIAEIIVNDFQAYECGVLLLTDDRSKIIRKAYSGPEIIEEEDFVSMDWDGLTTSAIKTGERIYAPDVHKDPRYRAGDENTQSEFVVPLQAYGEIIGVINMESPKLDDFSERTRRLVSAFAQNATLAIQNAKLLATLEASVASLRESQSRINFFLEHTAEGVYRIDYDPPIPINLPIEEQFRLSVEHGKIAECNVAFANMYGLSTREEMIGKPYIEFYGEEGYESNMEGNLEFMRRGYKVDDLETEEFNIKGEKVYFANNVVGIIRDGYFVSTWGTQRDITLLKKALSELEKNLAELKESQARINFFLEHTAEGVYRVDYDPPIPINLPFEEQYKLSRERGRFGECNVAIARMYGYSSREEMLNGPYYLENEGTEASRNANIEFYSRGYKTDDYETEEYTPAGDKVYFLNNAVGIIRDGYFMSIWGTQRDITPLKKALIELEKRNAELERFNYTLSHELKTPIVTIRGFLGFLENDMKTGNIERAKVDLTRIGNAADKMYKMISELLELSRIGRVINSHEDVQFEEIVEAGLNNAEASINERNVQVYVQPNLPAIHVDLTRMIEVVQNLVENAIKYMGDQPNPQITIGMRSEKNEMILFVSDNGMGIDPEYHERIFNIFEKLNPQSPGTGIGLALVKRIIETHGGRIWVESEGTGKGATFCFTLPMSKL